MRLARKSESTVQSVTSAAEHPDADLHARMRQYLWTMGVRTACFFLAFVTDGWIRWTCVVLAVVLPYIAVVLANAHAPRRAGRVAAVTTPRRMLDR